MLRSIRTVYARQWPLVQGDPALEAAYHRGLRILTDIFIDCLRENVTDGVRLRRWRKAARAASLLVRETSSRALRSVARSRRVSA